MDFRVPDRILELRKLVRSFVDKELIPLELDVRHESFREMLPKLAEKRDKARQTGLWAAHLPEDVGGGGLSLVEFAHMSEELGLGIRLD